MIDGVLCLCCLLVVAGWAFACLIGWWFVCLLARLRVCVCVNVGG